MAIVEPPFSPPDSETAYAGTAGLKKSKSVVGDLLFTFLTTLVVFGIFFVQGIILARILGPIGRGEFGTAVFFPRDMLLYVGLLGGIEVVTRFSANRSLDANLLRYSAVTLGLFSGILTAIIGALISVVVLLAVNDGAKAYLIPYCLIVCCFVPWEHIHLNVSGVDRGRELFARYNINRLVFAAIFPAIVCLAFVGGAIGVDQQNTLAIVCGLFVVSRIVGLYPTIRGLTFTGWVTSLKEYGFAKEKSSDDNQELLQPSSRSLLKQGWPYAFSMFASELFERLDILLILALASVQESGFYFVAVPVAALLTIAPNSLAVFTFNAGAEKQNISMRKAIAVVAGTVVFQAISMVVLWFAIPLLIVPVYGQAFAPVIPFVWYLLPAFAIKGFLQAMDGYLKGCGRPMIGVWARLLSTFVMLAFVGITYSQYQLFSIPMAACVGQFLSMVIVTYFALRHVNVVVVEPDGGSDANDR